jgi:hypothetical protein
VKTFSELREKKDPCWKGYTQVGMKKKDGKEVPNCVPSDGVEKAKGYKKEDYTVVSRGPGFEMRKNTQTGKVTRVWVESTNIEEKAVSKAQQKFMGMVRAKQKGEMDDASPEVTKAAKSMSKKDVKDFASTKHKGLPTKKESVDEADSWMKDSGWRKAQKMRKDRYGNTVKDKNVAKHLAKSAQKKTAGMDK